MRTTVMNMDEIRKRVTYVKEPVEVCDRGDYVEVRVNAHGDTVAEVLLCMTNLINLIRCPFKFVHYPRI